MNNLLTVITTLFCVVLINSSSLNAQTIAFERSSSDEIWTSDINGDNLQFICEGREPDISPNGMYIAFTKGYRVGYVNVKTKETHIFNSIPTDRCHEPKWSPNRDMIAFMYLSSTWRVGVVDFEDTYFNPLSEVKEKRSPARSVMSVPTLST